VDKGSISEVERIKHEAEKKRQRAEALGVKEMF
jgi:hypothetical protein